MQLPCLTSAAQSSENAPQPVLTCLVLQFLTTYKVPLPPVESTYTSPYLDTLKVSVTRNAINAIKQTRSVDIVLDHPGIIWPVLSFDGDVIAWGACPFSPLLSPTNLLLVQTCPSLLSAA